MFLMNFLFDCLWTYLRTIKKELCIILYYRISKVWLLCTGHRKGKGTDSKVSDCTKWIPEDPYIPGWWKNHSGWHHCGLWPASGIPICKTFDVDNYCLHVFNADCHCLLQRHVCSFLDRHVTTEGRINMVWYKDTNFVVS